MPFTEADFTAEFCDELLAEHLTIRAAVRSIQAECLNMHGRPAAERTVIEWVTRHCSVSARQRRRAEIRELNAGRGVDLSRPADTDRINRIDDLLDRANVPLEAIGAITGTKLKAYSGFIKNADGHAERVPMYSTTVDIAPPRPDFPVIQPAPTTTIAFVPPPRILRRTRSIAVVSDIQIGYLRHVRTEALEPIHDPLAIDVAMQIVADVAPSELIFIGDVTDLAPFSRWQKYPEYQRTLQPAIDTTHGVLGGFVAAAGARCTKRVMIGSNHDQRIEKGVLEWNMEALGVRRAGQPDGWPVFSLGYLARFDDLGLDWSGHYPGGEYYALDNLLFQHAPPKSKEFQGSVVHGHDHKLTRQPVVQHARHARQVYYVASCGCLCQTGSTTDKHRLLGTQVPSDQARTNFIQGIAVVNIVEDKFPLHAIELIEIMALPDSARLALYAGKPYTSRPTLLEAA